MKKKRSDNKTRIISDWVVHTPNIQILYVIFEYDFKHYDANSKMINDFGYLSFFKASGKYLC